MRFIHYDNEYVGKGSLYLLDLHDRMHGQNVIANTTINKKRS